MSCKVWCYRRRGWGDLGLQLVRQQLHQVEVAVMVRRHLQLKVVLGEGVWWGHDPRIAHDDVQPLVPQSMHERLYARQVRQIQLQNHHSLLRSTTANQILDLRAAARGGGGYHGNLCLPGESEWRGLT